MIFPMKQTIAKQTIHMICQYLFSLKNKNNNNNSSFRLLQFVIVAVRANVVF